MDVAKSPLGVLRFLYVGSSDVSRDLEYYTKTLEAKKVWDFTSMGPVWQRSKPAADPCSSSPATAPSPPFYPCSRLRT